MKRIPLLIVLWAIAISSFSQKIIENPKHGLTTVSNLKITRIELSDSITTLSFKYSGNPGDRILIPGGSCIQPLGSTERYFLKRLEGIPLNNWYTLDNSSEVSYRIIFPAIDPETERIDFLEANDGGSWFIYDIRLKDIEKINPLLEELQNVWFNTSGNKVVEIALYDTVAVYQSQLWSYGDIQKKGKITKVELINDGGSQTLYFESTNKHTCKMGTDKRNLVYLYDWPNHVDNYRIPDDKPYSSPVLNPGVATYSGYIKDYTPRAGFKTGIAHPNNTIVGDQESYTIKVQPNGYFTVSIPLISPEEIFLDMPVVNRTVFLEPGKETFQLIDGGSVYNGLLFQGEMAPVNNGLFELKDIHFFNYQEMRDSILKMTPEEYKVYVANARDKELQAFNDTIAKKFISEKASQIKQKSIEFSYLENLLSYNMNYRGALQERKGRDNPVTEKDLPKLDSSYYDFLTEDIFNDELGLLTSIYYFFINRLKYCDLLQALPRQNILTTEKLMDYIASKGVEFTPDEKKLIEHQKEVKSKSINWDSFNEKYGTLRNELIKQLSDTLRILSNNSDFVLWYDLKDVAIKKGITLTNEQEEMIAAVQAMQSREEAIALKDEQLKWKDATNAFYTKYNSYTSMYFSEMREKARDIAIKEKLGIDKSFVMDVMNAQDKLRPIVTDYTPVSEQDLERITAGINTPAIADYIRLTNEQIIKKVAELKENSDYVVNQTPEVDSDQLFEKMMEKFKGKVVFVDFWATWCGPCRSGMKRMQPLRTELADEPVIFVFITNQTSPENTWKATIAETGGEHYRLDKDEWNVLCERFGVSGIPHYILVDKEGKVAKNNGMPTYNENGMKKLFDEYINQ